VAPPWRWPAFAGHQVEFPDWRRAVADLEETMRLELRCRNHNSNEDSVDGLIVRMWCTELQAMLRQHVA
jgi:hypothetical protein